MLRINKESLLQDLAARAASVEVVKIGADWRCEAYDSRGYYIGGSSAGSGASSLARMQEDAYEIARFITQPIAQEV